MPQLQRPGLITLDGKVDGEGLWAHDLGDLATGIDRPALTLVLAAIAHVAGSHEHHHIARHSGVTQPGGRLGPVVPRPQPNLQCTVVGRGRSDLREGIERRRQLGGGARSALPGSGRRSQPVTSVECDVSLSRGFGGPVKAPH